MSVAQRRVYHENVRAFVDWLIFKISVVFNLLCFFKMIDKREPLSVKQTLELFQRQHWGNF